MLYYICASKFLILLTCLLIRSIKRVSIHDPRPTAESAKHIKQEKFISSKVHNQLMLIANLKYGVFLIISCIVALSRTSILKI